MAMHASSHARESFLSLLAEHGSLGNAKARELLGLDAEAYESLKASLLAEELIVLGRGRGGSIRLAGPEADGLKAVGFHFTQGANPALQVVAASKMLA
jgi:hypothetical protein